MKEKSILPAGWEVPTLFHTRLGTSVGRQRPMVKDGHLLLVLHAPPKPEENERVGRYFWRSPDGTWLSNGFGRGVKALKKHLDEYEDQISVLDQQVEEAKTSEDYFDVLEELTPIHRAARNMHQVLQEARTTCPDVLEIIDLRDRAYAIERTADLLFSGTQNELDFIVAKRSEQQAHNSHQMASASHRLNILAALFFPIITITAIFGVDTATVAKILGVDETTAESRGFIPLVFLGFIIVGFIAGTILVRIVNRRALGRTTSD